MSYARWCKDNEIKEILKKIDIKENIEKAGVPITGGGNKLFINDRDGHSLIVGATGSGKTQATILPLTKLAMKANEGIMIHDPKGDIYSTMGYQFEKNGYNVVVINFDKPNLGNAWNPFVLPYSCYKNGNKDRAISLLEDIGHSLFFDDNDKNIDSFWINSTIDYFTGLALYLFENANEDEIHLNSIFALSNSISDEVKLKSFLEKLDKNSSIYYNVSGTLTAPMETRGGILSTFNQRIKKYISKENLSNMLSYSDFNIEEIGIEKTAIFVITGNNSYSNYLIPLLVGQVVESINSFGSHKKYFNIVLDEFDELLPIRDFARIINYSRSIRIKFTIVLRSYINLNQIYGKEVAEIIKYSITNIIYLWSNDIYTLKEISLLCGNQNKDNVPLITPEELKMLKTFEAIILIPRMMPFRTNLIPDYKLDWGFEMISKDIPSRENKELKIFNF